MPENDRPEAAGAEKARAVERLSRWACFVALGILLVIAVAALPQRFIVCPLDPQDEIVEVTGIVRSAPYNAPLAHATVFSDRELVVTDPSGAFRLDARRGSHLRVEAPGFDVAGAEIKDESPLIFLLFPRRQALEATNERSQ